MEQLIIDTLEQYFTSGNYEYCEPNISPTEYRIILADLKKLEKIEQIMNASSYTENGKVYSYCYDNDTRVKHIKEVLEKE